MQYNTNANINTEERTEKKLDNKFLKIAPDIDFV